MVIAIFFLVVPIVIKVVREKSVVMAGFAYVTKKEIGEIIEWASVFDVHLKKVSFKLLAETRKEKVLEIMKIDNEEHTVKEDKKDPEDGQEQDKSSRLRNLIRNVFKFGDNSPKESKEEDQAGFDSYLSKKQYSHEDPVEHSTDNMSKAAKKNEEEKKEENQEDSILPLNIKPVFDEEEIICRRKKESLSKIDLSLRRRSLLKISIIFILFMIYLIINLIYIVMVHSYALKASKQNNHIQMRRALMAQVSLMCFQAFFENDPRYLTSQSGSVKHFPEYKDRLLEIEESVLEFEKKGPKFIFPGYVKKIGAYNSDQFCSELKEVADEESECAEYDSGFFKNGLRASQFRYVTFWQGLAQKFLKEGDAADLQEYRYGEEVSRYSMSSCYCSYRVHTLLQRCHQRSCGHI
eukprot:TRINITY_DN395_c0_g4_i3.p1 TRINITY_DN395_c0_g4~~TRINITY_DN395_c0_g4_i3.p1  ORF type:complete len:407 (+),score=125.75 TRINITY_DN395_c0_g4_i3:1619-2839(+)